jgi:hypothetical protein
MEINRPDVLADVTAAVDRYEKALVTNDTATLGELFWNSPHVLRYGPAENLHGYEQIAGFRAARSPLNVEFLRPPSTRIGRQSQAWARTPDGWKVVAAHVSLIEEKK